MPTFIAYYRVSTQGQGQSGLGLKAQQADVMRYVKDAALLVETFTDVESGKKDNRPQLMEAIKAAKEKGATLVIRPAVNAQKALLIVTLFQLQLAFY